MAELNNYEDFMNAEQTSTLKETDRKCPQCGGVMDFDPATGGLHCPFCDYTEEIKKGEEQPDHAQELDFASAELTGNCDWGVAQKTVTCKSCGATSVYDALEVANECPYCGSNQVMEANDVSTLAPNGVVPFKITAKQAGENFQAWLKRKWFCPKEAKRSAKADKFQGIYLPYWTFDADTDTTYTAQYGIDRKEKHGDQERTVTDWHNTSGRYQHFIDDELVIASNHHDSSILSMVEPFDTADNKAYKPEYMAGYAAERYSLGLKDAWEKAKQFIKNRLHALIESKIRSDHHADSVRNLNMNTTYSNITYKYLMLPIYISSFTYKGKIYQFMVNGQSGKVGGRSPISALRVMLAILIAVVIIWLLYVMTQ
ncbi:MAG: hypothetical protein IJU25_04995 [Lachnospiraceae bacterium]|nr:hypothetical protein [Lachnospiraceae bacterium]